MVVEFPWWIYPVLVWTLFWKGIALWKSARNNQGIWFIVSLGINTLGILPIIYLQWFQQDWNRSSKKLIKKKKTISGKKIKKRKFPSLPR